MDVCNPNLPITCLVKGLFYLALWSCVIGPAAALPAGDAFSTWVLDRAAGGRAADRLVQVASLQRVGTAQLSHRESTSAWQDEAVREVAEGVLEIPLGYVNAHLVVVDDGVVLVDARVVAHAADVRTISGERPEPTTRVKVARLVMGPVRPTPVDERLTVDGPISAPGFRAVHTPGHTAGHVSYLLDPRPRRPLRGGRGR